jgi:hypothetical protein
MQFAISFASSQQLHQLRHRFIALFAIVLISARDANEDTATRSVIEMS